MNKIIFIFLFLVPPPLFGQTPFSYQLSEKDGLKSNAIFDIHLSKEGFLFAGTARGLMKYDGKKFEEISTGSMTMQISGFYELSANDIYFLTFSGRIFCYQHDSLRLIKQLGLEGIRYPTMNNLSSTKMIFCANNGFYTFESNGERAIYHKLPVKDTSETNKKSVLLGALKNGVLIRCQNELFEIDSTGSNVKKIYSEDPVGSLFALREAFQFGDKKYVLGRSSDKVHLALYEFSDGTIRIVKSFPEILFNQLQNIAKTESEVNILTKNGYFILNSMLAVRRGTAYNNQSISQMRFLDGARFIATTNNGIWVEPSNSLLRSKEEFTDKLVPFLHTYKESIFYLTEAGEFNSCFPKKSYPSINLSKDATIFTDYSGNAFFLGATDNYHLQLDKKNIRISKHLETYTYVSWVSDLDLYLICNDRYFALASNKKTTREWIRKNFEVLREFKKSLFDQFNQDKKVDYFILKNKTASKVLFSRKDSSIYLTSFDGLYHYKPNKNPVQVQYKNNAFNAHELVLLNDGSVITNGVDGIFKIEEDEVTRVYSTKNGLISNHSTLIKSIKDTLLVFYDKSIQIFTEKEGVIQTFTSKTNLPVGEIFDATLLHGKIYISTREGIFISPVKKNIATKPKAFIRYVEAGEKRWPRNEKIPFAKNSLVFKINGLDLLNRGAFHYEYRLQGTSNPKWIVQDATFDAIRFYSLSEGSYSLELKVVPDFGPESDITKYDFTISPPFVRSWIFYLLCFLFALGIVSLIFYLRTRAIRRKAEFDKQVKQSEITAIKAQMNPHFVFNALNSIQSWVVTKDVKNSNLYLGKFSKLVRKTLEVSEKNAIPLSEEIYIIQLYLDLENLRFGEEIKIEFKVEIPEEEHHDIYVPAMLIQPYIENVFKHGLLHKKGKKELEILFTKEHDKLLCTIQDNGVGIKKSTEINKKKKQHTSFSTRANEKRIEILNEMFNNEISLEITDAFPEKEDCGTLIRLQLPLLDFDLLNEMSHSPKQ